MHNGFRCAEEDKTMNLLLQPTRMRWDSFSSSSPPPCHLNWASHLCNIVFKIDFFLFVVEAIE